MAPLGDASDITETVIFVDVDGVLNVGIRDQEDAPLLFNESNKEFALSQAGRRQSTKSDEECVQKLLAVAEHPVPSHGEAATCCDLACGRGCHVSEALAKNLASVVTAAGDRCTVVLSSNWRKPSHAHRVRKLEAEVTKHLGRTFTFDAKTRLADERCAADRLRCIGDYVESITGPGGRFHNGQPLRLLVLEDFFITPLNGWLCGNSEIVDAASAEAYLLGRANASANVAAKLVHTYEEFTTNAGLLVQVGCGLTNDHFRKALDFVEASVTCQAPQEQRRLPKPTILSKKATVIPVPPLAKQIVDLKAGDVASAEAVIKVLPLARTEAGARLWKDVARHGDRAVWANTASDCARWCITTPLRQQRRSASAPALPSAHFRSVHA